MVLSLSFTAPLRPAVLQSRFERRSRRLDLVRGVRESLVSLAGLTGRPVRLSGGELVGRVADILVRTDSGHRYPPLSGILARVGWRRVFIPADAITTIGWDQIRLGTARLDLREFVRRDGEVLLGRDILDHQLVDVDDARVVRASDLYLAQVAGTLQLVGVDVSMASLLRRLGPARWRARPTPDVVIDWASVHDFRTQPGRGGVRLVQHRGELNRLRPAELADLLETLGRRERTALLEQVGPQAAADALEEMTSHKVHQLLTDTERSRAAGLVAEMEPDEAIDALRDLNDSDRTGILAAMPDDTAATLRDALDYPRNQAGGIMTTILALTRPNDTVATVRATLRELAGHVADLDAVAVVDTDGRLIDDISLGELLLAEPDTSIASLIGPPWPVTVTADTPVPQVAERLTNARRLSVVVIDPSGRPLGRILADDVLDAMTAYPGRRRPGLS